MTAKILLVDDDRAALFALRELLSAHADRRRQPRAATMHEWYLQKPLVPGVVREKVAELIEQYQPQVLLKAGPYGYNRELA